MPYRNGQRSWEPPSERAILLEISSRLGGLETGQRMTLEAVETSFDRIGALDRRISHVEAGTGHLWERIDQMQSSPLPAQSTQPPQRHGLLSSATGLVSALRDLTPLIKALAELAIIVGVLMLALKGALEPAEVKAWLKP